jgi:hypothetical protein
MSVEDACVVQASLSRRYGELGQTTDLRSWNLSRRTAYLSLKEYDAHLQEQCQSHFFFEKHRGGR